MDALNLVAWWGSNILFKERLLKILEMFECSLDSKLVYTGADSDSPPPRQTERERERERERESAREGERERERAKCIFK